MEIIAKSLSTPHVSTMSGKLNGLQAINTDTVSNTFCQKMNSTGNSICTKCYSMNSLTRHRKNCRPAFMGNSELLSKSILQSSQIPFINQSYFRFHGHGEIINMTHLWNFVQIARANPHCTFALWTKRKDFVRQMMTKQKYTNIPSGKPANIKVFNNITKSGYKGENCTGQKCIECLACYRKDSGVDVIIEKVK